MTVRATYDELARYFREKYGHRLTLKGIDAATVLVTYSRLVFSKDVRLRIVATEPSSVVMEYDAGAGFMDRLFRKLAERLTSGFPGLLTFNDPSRVEINLDAIEQLGLLLEHVALAGVRFEEKDIVLDLTLKGNEDAPAHE